MDKTVAVFCLLFFLYATGGAYELPDATSRTLVFCDQLNDAPGSANFNFSATHFVGTQKVDKERIAAYKAINPKFIVVQYHKSYGVDLQSNITSPVAPAWNNDCDTFYAWVNRHPLYGGMETYYLHYTNAIDSAHRIKHYWNNINEYYLADPRHAGWRQYVSETNVWRCENIGFDGTFFDATYFPSYGYDPENWFDSIPYSAGGITNFAASWNQTFAVPYWAFIRDYFHSAGRNYLCLVNCDQMVTGWYNDAYLDSVDGAMAEGFFTYGGKLTGADWSLSAGRILRYITGSGQNKVLIAQCSPAANDQSARRWCIANYLLLKNKYSYYSFVSGSNASWWPEYDIALDSFLTRPATLGDLLVHETASLYKREYKSGLVLVNPGSGAQSYSLSQRYNPVTFSGGGDVANGALPQMTLTYGAAIDGSVLLAAGEVLILRKEGASTIPGLARNFWRKPNFKPGAVYTITGKLVGVTVTTGKRGRPLPACSFVPGVYLVRDANNDNKFRLSCIIKQ